MPADIGGRGLSIRNIKWRLPASMSIFKRNIKSPKIQGSTDDGARLSLFLYISDMGWQMQFSGETGELVGERQSEDCSLLTGTVSVRMEAILGRAIKSLSKKDRRRIGRIHIVLSDQATVLLDDAGGEFGKASPSALRQMAQQQLNCQSASYCVSELEMTAGKIYLYGMADARILGAMLHQLGDMAPSVVEIAPAAGLLACKTAGLDHPYCALLLDGYNAKIVVTDMVNACVVVRTLPIGIMSLPAAVAQHTRVNLTKAQSGLQQRDIIATLDVASESRDAGQGLSKGPFYDAMAPLLLALKREIEDTLRFVTDQRLGRRPAKIEVFGELNKVNGLLNWLNSNLDLPVEASQQDLFELFTTKDEPSAMNLLTGADGPLVTVGKIKYKFSQDGFIEDVPAPTSNIDIEQSPARQGSRRRGPRGRQRGGRPNPDQRGLFGLPFLKFHSGGQSQGSQTGETTPQGLHYVLLSVVFFGALYGAYIAYYEDTLRLHSNAKAAYAQALSANEAARRQINEDPSKMNDPTLRARRDDDKVLWSEKMLALAGHMDDKMWISEVYLVNETATFNAQSISVRKLTIEGAVLPSTDGHILEIARYISRLTEDRLFMRDFSRVTFEGATIDTQESAHVVRFTLDAWYDETKVEDEMKDGKGGGSTGNLMQKVNSRTNQLESVRDGTK